MSEEGMLKEEKWKAWVELCCCDVVIIHLFLKLFTEDVSVQLQVDPVQILNR